MNQAPCNKHWILCCFTNSNDSLYSLARRFLKRYRISTGTCQNHHRILPNRYLAQQIIFKFQFFHLSISHSSILAFNKILLYLVPGANIFSSQSNFDSFEVKELAMPDIYVAKDTYWLRTRATTRVKSPAAAPLSLHMRMKNWVARQCTLQKSKKNGWNVVDVESMVEDINYFLGKQERTNIQPGAKMAQCSESSSTTSLDTFAIGHLRSSSRLSCSRITY